MSGRRGRPLVKNRSALVDAVLAVRVTTAEANEVRRAAKSEAMQVSEWMRRVLVDAARHALDTTACGDADGADTIADPPTSASPEDVADADAD